MSSPVLVPDAVVRPISDAQLAANRLNAQKSTGPSVAGRAISSQNRTTHGLARHNGEFRLLKSEDPTAFAALKDALTAEHKPVTETERILVNTMIESHWLANRAENLQATVSDPATGEVTNLQLASLYLRYYTTHQRAFNKALADLVKLRKEKRIEENGFEAQKRRAWQSVVRQFDQELKQLHAYEMERMNHPNMRVGPCQPKRIVLEGDAALSAAQIILKGKSAA